MPPAGAIPTFAAVYQAHATDVHNLVQLLVPAQDVGDVEHECWTAIASSLPRYDPAQPLKPWINTIVRRTIFRRRGRSDKRWVLLPDEIINELSRDRRSIADAVVGARELLDKILQSMSERQRDIFLRHLRDRHSTEKIAEDIGISHRGVQKALERARSKAEAVLRRQDASERRALRKKQRAFMLPLGLTLDMKAWLAEVRAMLMRAFTWVKGTAASFTVGAGVVATAGAIAPLPEHPCAPATEGAPAVAAMAVAAPALPEVSDAPAEVSREATTLPASSAKSTAGPSFNSVSVRPLSAEMSSLQGIEALLETDPEGALAALELHKKAFPRERLHGARRRIEMLVQKKIPPRSL